jgi:hypothetical protein
MVYVKHETVVTGDVWRMHLLPENAGALFQLASLIATQSVQIRSDA